MARLLRAPLGRRVGPSCQLAVSARGRALLMPWSRQDDCRASGAAEVGWGAARPIGPIDRTPARRIQPYSQLPGRAVRRGRAQRARFPACRRAVDQPSSGLAAAMSGIAEIPAPLTAGPKWSSKTRKCQAKWCVDIGGSVRLCRNQRASDTRKARHRQVHDSHKTYYGTLSDGPICD